MYEKPSKKCANSAVARSVGSPILPFLAILPVALILMSCSAGAPAKDRTEVCRSKAELVQKRFDEGKYWQIKEDLHEIISTCQGTGFLENSQFLLAESHFRLKEWIEARGEYGSFTMSFPGSSYAEVAAFRRAVSSFNMSFRDARDDANTNQAIQDFQEFRDNWPSSGLLDSAQFFIGELRERLAANYFATARLYWRMKEPQASAIYLKLLLEEFPETRRRKDAHLLLIDSYIRLEQFEQAQFHIEKFLEEAGSEGNAEASKRQVNLAKARERFEARLRKEQRRNLERRVDEG